MPALRFAALTATFLALSAAIAAAEEPPLPDRVPCSDYASIAQQLGARYEEAPVSLGLQSNGNVLQVFASATSGTWTVVSLTPSGYACILAAGESWESIKEAPAMLLGGPV
jgi:hypothetical protein